ncbi:hypothetical protein [Gabonibacter chumensis]|uniref:hypothetical protein n=1 Tax=Gabonibacter chumensis TaxID=2972474 RepID=UPI0025734F26|nr:hypothetical protein [Gabonibacter chumensis]MCR9010910.1 hypothetical protein [Gabonibacter chumensis]
MRKIAANYIFLPGYPLVRNGYVVIDGQNVVDVVNTGGFIREIPGLEFYGGMIVAGFLMSDKRDWCPGDDLLSCMVDIYDKRCDLRTGLALVQGADWEHFRWSEEASVLRLV